MNEQLLKQIQAIITFKQAFMNLTEVWELEDTNLNDLESNKYYPFERSFNEYDVSTWTNETFKELSTMIK